MSPGQFAMPQAYRPRGSRADLQGECERCGRPVTGLGHLGSDGQVTHLSCRQYARRSKIDLTAGRELHPEQIAPAFASYQPAAA